MEYKNESQFRKEITDLANIAKEEILFYRKLRDIEFAKNWIIAYTKKTMKENMRDLDLMSPIFVL
ncbi:hypothetical protein [Treponema sp. UBA6852]|uniref:hypothetical protein n=1 Tax=Treponema sp. UBA6852 TaxID=1947744 RepID=UPI0025F58381|nr:hypothetical protein [Treponema sp. UBA6852]